MVSPAHNKRDPSFDPHSAYDSRMRKCNRHFLLLWRLKLYCAAHRLRRNAGLSRKNASVCHKSAKSEFRKLISYIPLIFRKIYNFTQTGRICIFIKQRGLYTFRHKLKQDLLKLPRIDRSSVCGKTDFHPQNDISTVRIKSAGRTFQNFLPAAAYSDHPTFSRTFCLKSKLTRQFILKRDPLIFPTVKITRKCRCLSFYMYAHL